MVPGRYHDLIVNMLATDLHLWDLNSGRLATKCLWTYKDTMGTIDVLFQLVGWLVEEFIYSFNNR